MVLADALPRGRWSMERNEKSANEQSRNELECRVCGKGFPTHELLERHLGSDHDETLEPSEQTESPTCARCGSTFDNLELLRQHQHSHERESGR
jgi:hypothetical protein